MWPSLVMAYPSSPRRMISLQRMQREGSYRGGSSSDLVEPTRGVEEIRQDLPGHAAREVAVELGLYLRPPGGGNFHHRLEILQQFHGLDRRGSHLDVEALFAGATSQI